MDKVLIIDDNQEFCRTLGRKVQRVLESEPSMRHTLGEGAALAETERFDVVFLDVNLPDGNGLSAIPRIKSTAGRPEIIIITGRGDPSGAALAIESGAWDYIQKGSSLEEMTLPLLRAMDLRRARRDQEAASPFNRQGLIGSSPAFENMLFHVQQAAQSDGAALIIGETGTGKERIAKAIHAGSRRAGGPYVVVDCAAIPEKLIESTLFGHMRGAFTGADETRDGLVRQANGGTLFLDEIGELPLEMQKGLLRVLQERTYRRVGSMKEEKADFRLIAATNRDLRVMAEEGRFRSDLYYRINTFHVDVPPLRDRITDLPDLARHFAAEIASARHEPARDVSQAFLDALASYPWPGNVRELMHAMEFSVSSTPPGAPLIPNALPAKIRVHRAQSHLTGGIVPSAEDAHLQGQGPAGELVRDLQQIPLRDYRQYREQSVALIERYYLTRMLGEHDQNVERVAGISGLSASRIYKLVKKLNLPLRRPRRQE